MKYTIRKLLFLLAIALMVAAPFAVAKYRSLTTDDPYILIARELEGYSRGGIDVLNVLDNSERKDGILIVVYIPDYPEWTVRQDHVNFNQAILQAIGRYQFTSVVVFIGWDFPTDNFKVQGSYACPEMRRQSCTWTQVASVELRDKFVKWPGIGKP